MEMSNTERIASNIIVKDTHENHETHETPETHENHETHETHETHAPPNDAVTLQFRYFLDKGIIIEAGPIACAVRCSFIHHRVETVEDIFPDGLRGRQVPADDVLVCVRFHAYNEHVAVATAAVDSKC